MSKVSNAFFIIYLAFICLVLSAGNSHSQNIEATIDIDAQTASVSVTGRNASRGIDQPRNLSFLKSSIGAPDLAARISNLSLTDASGVPIRYKNLQPGEFSAEAPFSDWSYKTNAALPKNSRATAHVSWLSESGGILMLDDLLPQFSNRDQKVSSTLTLRVPAGWKIISTEKRIGLSTFEVADVEKAVFQIGTDVREIKVDNPVLKASLSGEWLFTDDEFAKIADEIYSEYRQIFAADPAGSIQIAIMPFPQQNIQKGTWEAETRGRTVIIVSNDMPFKTQSVQRLHEQLRHEIFHLWVPNGLSLSGSYDWFYEGFALYQSLKTGVSLNQIRFEDFLDTLSRAHNIDSMHTRGLSLIEASQNRWKGNETQVYARGMLVAFLCDLTLLQSSKGRTAVSDIFRRLYASHRSPNPVGDANTSILKVLEAYTNLSPLMESYIKGSKKIDWVTQLEAAGIENEPGKSRTNLRVKAKLNGSQKALLDKLGYNNWRKLTRKS